ncbi:MAG: AAA family ATPase, partial [Deltaproteobacteria bacterium]|nr:AAA family ATPase [Deltaproteobacteria bacterium]
MHRDQLQFVQPPFQDTVDTSFFFTGGMRRDAVDVIKDALSRRVSLITLTGDDGSGKTMVCRMLQKELPPGLACVFLPQTVESFNEMIQIVAEEIFSEPLEKEKEKDVKALEGQIIEALRESEQRLVIIFDEAEKIFLATLERIRRLVDRVNEQGDFLQVIFSGHTRFIDNLNQLQIVTFQDIEECHVSLDPLDQEATW